MGNGKLALGFERAGALPAGAGGRRAARPGWLASERARALVVVAPMLLLVFAAYWYGNTDPDYWWHVRTGEWIWEHRELPRTDPFSHTVAGAAWVTHEWLTQVIFYVVQRTAGFAGLVALWGLVGVATSVTVYRTCRLWGVGELASTIMMLWAFIVGVGSSASVRPQVLTLLFLALFAYLLTRYRHGDTRALRWLPPLMALWVNLHGGYVIGLALLGLTVVGEAMAHVRGGGVPLRPLIMVSLLSGAATLVNPNGLDALVYPFTYAGSGNASMRYINEWQSPDFHLAYFLTLAVSLLLLIVLGVGRGPLGPTEVLWTLAFAFLALRSVRHIPLYGVIVLPLLAARLSAELPALRRGLAAWRRPALLLALWPAVLCGLIVMGAGVQRLGLQLQTGAEPHANTYPAGAVDWIVANRPAGNLFNEYGWGGYLVYRLYPERTVFIDGRADVYGDDFIERYADVERLKPGWRDTLDEFGVTLVLLTQKDPLGNVLAADPGWTEVYTGPVERLFQRRGT